MAIYTGVSQLEWREVEGGQLPSPRFAPKAAMVNKIIFITGGSDDSWNDMTSIFSWDPPTESWQQAGNLAVARSYHAAVAIPSSFIESECSEIPTTVTTPG